MYTAVWSGSMHGILILILIAYTTEKITAKRLLGTTLDKWGVPNWTLMTGTFAY
jgi:hypothetical protein